MQFGTPANDALTSEVDFFYWPNITGERYPPTLTSAAYAVAPGGNVGIRCTSAALGNRIVYPAISRTRVGDAAPGGFRLETKLYILAATSAGAGAFQLQSTPGNYPPVIEGHWSVPGGWLDLYGQGSGSLAPYLGRYGLDQWITVEMQCGTSGVYTITINGVDVYTYSGSSNIGDAIRVQLQQLSAVNLDMYLSGLRITYL